MIKAVLFDFGGVLTEGGKAGSIARTFAKIYGIEPTAVRLEGDELRNKLLRGTISDDEFLDELNRRHGGETKATKELFEHYGDIFNKAEPVYEVAAALREQGIRTGILSNVFGMSVARLRSEGFYDGFDPILLSCEEHIIKPEPAFYKLALERLGLPAEEVLFIDDQERILAPARKLGMHTILAISPQQIVRDIKKVIKAENGVQL